VLERPRRLAAIGGAAVICVLSLSGALGISPTGQDAHASQPPAVGLGPHATSAGGGGAAGAVDRSSGNAVGQGSPDTAASDHQSTADHAQPSTQNTALPADSGTGRRIVFDVSAQRVWLVNADGAVARSYLVSGSRFDNLDNGTYQVTSRDRHATAYNSDETMNYMVRFAMGRTAPIGFHSIPQMPDGTLVESRSELGAPASDGCIRQWITDARALWKFAPDGTTVVVRA
jgi:lipoprotein-anchoring transpeptidase ErfK/SrfK